MLVKFIFPSVRSVINNMEVCRVTHSGSLKSLDLDWVAKHLVEVTNLKRDTIFSLYYYDQTETNGFVEVTSKADFKKMVNYFLDLDQTCRIYAIPHPYTDKKPLNSFFSYCHADELPNILEKPSSDSVNEKNEDPWLKSHCKLCENPNLNKERFTCLFCSNVVLCRLCYLTGYHKEHPLICTRNTGAFSQRLLQHIRIAVAAVPWNYTLPRTNNVTNELKRNSNLSPGLNQPQFFPISQTTSNTNHGKVITAPNSPNQPIRKRRTFRNKTKSQEFK